MKKLLFVIVLLPTMVFGQDFDPFGSFVQTNIFNEWKKYLNDCNELVPDTIRQYGTVKCDLVPVKMNGKIVSYNTVSTDTIWNECNCDDYKTIDFSSRNFTLSGDYISVINGGWTTSSVYSEPELAKNTFSIKRNKICMIKKRKASFEDFWNRWLVEKGMIEFN